MKFEELGLDPDILKGVTEANFTEPSPIQALAIPVILEGKDIIAQAQTGTGKTAAFGLPSMNNIVVGGGVQLLVITPTRELCMQVSDELFKLGRFKGVKTVAVYGGQSISRQVDLIRRGATVVVATPGRLLDHLASGRLENFNPQIVVLDEADEMLDMGFLDDIEEIFNYLPSNKQTLLFSATMAKEIMALAQKILFNPEVLRVESKETTNKDIEQLYFCVEERERLDALTRLIDNEAPTKAIIFSRTKKDCDELATMLISKGYFVKALHGDLDQRGREEVIKAFRAGALDMIVATDVAARGLDVEGISHVFNYHIPLDPESYVHRIGRTGRAGRKGRAITIVTPLEFKELGRIKKLTKAEIYHEEIPTLTDLQDKHRNKLLEQIKSQHIAEEAIEIVKSLEDEMDSQTLIYKLLSKLIGKKEFQGPNRLGLSKKMVEKILKDNFDRRDDRGGRGRFGGNRSYGNRDGGRGRDDRGGRGRFGGRGDRPRDDRPRDDRPRDDRPRDDRPRDSRYNDRRPRDNNSSGRRREGQEGRDSRGSNNSRR